MLSSSIKLDPVMDGPSQDAAATVAFLLSLRAKGVRQVDLLRAMESVPRHLFAPARCADLSRADVSLPLPCGQTMLSPSAIAVLLSRLAVGSGQRILEVGTGSGYVTALLSRLAREVVSLERYRTLAIAAGERLKRLDTPNAHVLHADGLSPDPAIGAFDGIVMTGSVAMLPTALLGSLAPGGRLVGVVVLGGMPRLITVERSPTGAYKETLFGTLHIPPLAAGLARAL